eukprot:5761387-Pyramimonas_sp.AAC.1
MHTGTQRDTLAGERTGRQSGNASATRSARWQCADSFFSAGPPSVVGERATANVVTSGVAVGTLGDAGP